MSERVSLAVANGIAEVRLSRPGKRNAIDLAMFEAIAATIGALAARDDVRVVVLSGEGAAFCAGIDLGALEQVAAVDLGRRTHGPANLFQQAAWGWRALPCPVIAAIHGQAFGGGLQIALGADIRIVAPDAQLSIMEAKWGLVPDMAGTVLLRGLVRDDVLRELTYTARIVGGHEAVAIGLATRVADDPHAEALALARSIAGQKREAMRAAKRLLAMSDEEAAVRLRAEAVEQGALLPSAVQMALRAGRKPSG